MKHLVIVHIYTKWDASAASIARSSEKIIDEISEEKLKELKKEAREKYASDYEMNLQKSSISVIAVIHQVLVWP